jgi:hypothetical protein
VTAVTALAVTDVTWDAVTAVTDPRRLRGGHFLPQLSMGPDEGGDTMAEKKISPKKGGTRSSSTNRGAATRVTKRRAHRKSARKSARKGA